MNTHIHTRTADVDVQRRIGDAKESNSLPLKMGSAAFSSF